ncbi:protein FAM222B-like [Xyrichtys novacula]|uniref:Protein FAM222B-like n=1 Tax=Xyrichtys novacula TaxID=13765 RepID=A0AAV1FTG1_XYRNO|nr:protein FAM222B-like [Xyrichtys novacula]
MLACLPASGDPTVRLLSRSQMNTGLQKWETTQKMRSASYPTPAELDAYAKKVANNPLTIQIFPNSVKVPQRKHIRRTVNGLDTSSSSQRHSPYPSQVSSSRGLLAVLRAPAKGVIKDSDGSRARQLHKAVMNPHSGPYAPQSTLNLPQPPPHLPGPSNPGVQAAQKQGVVHPQVLQQQQSLSHPMTLQQSQALPHPQALQQRTMAHSQALQRQQSLSQGPAPQQQRLALPPQGIQRQQSLPHTQALQQQQSQTCPQVVPQQQQQQQHLPHLQTLKHQAAPQQALLSQQGVTQDLLHLSDGAQLSSLQQSQGLVSSQPLPQAVGAGPPTMPNGLQQHPAAGAYGPRKLPDADAPPNVTVSTSTIPLSMAASLHQNRPGDLSSIVHQINQMCQARAGMGTTSVCEGQIANPSPISRNLLINASSRVSSHHPALGSVPRCLVVGPPDKATAQTSTAALHSQPTIAAPNSLPAFHTDPEKVHLQQQQQLQHHLHQQKQQQQLQQHQHLHQLQQLQHQHQQQQQRSWAQHQLAHMQQPPEGAHPCKNPRMELPAERSFPSGNLNYPHKLPSSAHSFTLKHPAEKPRPPSPVNCPAGTMPYINGHYMQPSWGNIPASAGNNGNGSQDLPVAFHGGQAAAATASTDRIPGAKYRPGKEGPPGGSKLMQNVDFLGGDFQIPNFQEQNMDVMQKMHRSAMGQVQEPNNGGGVHSHHPGYR